jgi:hypothetical protein
MRKYLVIVSILLILISFSVTSQSSPPPARTSPIETPTPTPLTYCGDGIKQYNPPNAARSGGPNNDGNEDCDDGPKGSEQCTSNCVYTKCGDGITQTPNGKRSGGPNNDGNEDCDDGNTVNTDSCVGQCVDAKCGDGYVWKNVEDCEVTDLNWNTCRSLGFDYGNLGCYPPSHPNKCKYDTTDCHYYECRTDSDCKGKSTNIYCQGGDVWGDKAKCYIEDHVCVRGIIEDCNSQNKFCHSRYHVCINCEIDGDCHPSYKCSSSKTTIQKAYCNQYNWLGNLAKPEDWVCDYKSSMACRDGTECVQETDTARCVIKPGEDCEDAYECPYYGNFYCKNNAVYTTDCISGVCNRLGLKIKDCQAGETCVETVFNSKFQARCVPNDRIWPSSTPQTSPIVSEEFIAVVSLDWANDDPKLISDTVETWVNAPLIS